MFVMEMYPLVDLAELAEPSFYAAHGYPHDLWARLRRSDPLPWVERAHEPFWVVTRHADIVHIGRHPELFLNAPMVIIPERGRVGRNFEAPPTLIEMDPPEHRAQRRIIASRFKPGAFKRIHADVERIARGIVDSLLEEGEEGEVDFVERVAAPLPIAVIAWLLGVPEPDWPLLFNWTNRIVGGVDPEFKGDAEVSASKNAIIEMYRYFDDLIAEKRRNPADDLITHFTRAEVDGRKLDQMQVFAWCNLIVVAGNETTRNATTGGLLALVEHPEQLRRIQADLGLLAPGVEEIVRWTSPIIHFVRTAACDTELRGKQVRKGDRLCLFYPSANRDEEVFRNPFTFDVTRHPNNHLGFGVGEHFCAGSHIARFELKMAYRYLLPRIDEIELAGPVERLHSSFVGGIKRLPIRYRLKPAKGRRS
ncbi:MAG: cytochrome P450 [Proteobacteria bacterium]|nr:cytochrome P450 [Pseudomonadota bacterium]